MITTIRISPAARNKLASWKSSPRETYDELLSKLLSLIPRGDELLCLGARRGRPSLVVRLAVQPGDSSYATAKEDIRAESREEDESPTRPRPGLHHSEEVPPP
jgi:hypothetical protein